MLASFFALSLGTVVLPGAPSAQAAEPAIAATTLEPGTATVGDRLTLRIVVEHDAQTTLAGPGAEADFGGLDLIDIVGPTTDGSGDALRTTLAYTLTAFETGDITVPEQAVEYTSPEAAGTLTTQPVSVTVESVLPPGESELRPLKPQLDLEEPAPSPAVPALFVAIFAALTVLGYAMYRRAVAMRPLPAPVAQVAPEPALHERARSALDEIAASGLAETDPPEYYARIAAVVRGYLSERFAFPAFAMTRRELEREMRREGIERWPARVTGNLLEQCEAAEFAGFVPAPERRAADLTAAYEIIEVTQERVIVPEVDR